MQKSIDIARKISKDLEKNWLPELEEINFHKIFQPVFKLNLNISDANSIVVFIIYAYDPDSQWLDLKKDRYENKQRILLNLDCVISKEVFKEILINSNDCINEVIASYLEELTNWRWTTVFTLLEYHSKMIRFANQETESEKQWDKMNKEGEVVTLSKDYDADVISKINKMKGDLLTQAIESREKADKLLEEIKKEFVQTDTATQGDFNFTFTDTAKKKSDVYSWREFIKSRNERKQPTA